MARTFPAEIVGTFADLGGSITTISAEWVPPPEEVAAEIMQVAGYLDDMSAPMRASQAIARADMQNHFDTETDPNGRPWAALDPDYLAYKTSIGANTSILNKWGDLEAEATSLSAFQVAGQDLFFDGGGLPDYGLLHQTGTGTGGTRAGYISRLSRDYKGSTHLGVGVGRGLDLPARPFVGISAEAEEQIFEVFDLWFAAGVSIAVGPTGIVQQRVRGKFGSKLYPDF